MYAKILSYVASIIVCLSAIAADACVDPMSKFYAGAVLNTNNCSSQEAVDFSRLEAMGTEGLNYFRVCDSSVHIGDSLSVHPGGLPQQLPSGPVFDAQVRIQLNMLTISLRHWGCCQGHLFNLHTTGALAKSIPPEIDFVLSHDAAMDPCDANGNVQKNMTFDLSSLLPSTQGSPLIRISIKFPGDTINHYYSWTPTHCFSCSYIYRSHSVGNAMVYLGYFSPKYQNAQPYPRIAVYFDTAIVPTAEQKANAVAAELRWLAAQSIVTGLSDVKISRIQSALTAYPEQYWTLQDTVLAYNMWFGGEGINGVYAVDGVKGVRGGCGLGASYLLPSKPLGQVAATVIPGKSGNFQEIRVINNCSRTILHFPYALETNVMIKVYNLRGAMIAHIKGVSGSRTIVWDRSGLNGRKVGPGHYIFVRTIEQRLESNY